LEPLSLLALPFEVLYFLALIITLDAESIADSAVETLEVLVFGKFLPNGEVLDFFSESCCLIRIMSNPSPINTANMSKTRSTLRIFHPLHNSFQLRAKRAPNRVIRKIICHQVLASLTEPIPFWKSRFQQFTPIAGLMHNEIAEIAEDKIVSNFI